MQYSITEFEDIYRRCHQQAFMLAMSMLHDADEARDIVQEAFLKLWESDSAIDNETAYIVRTVRNSCLNRIEATDVRERLKQKLSLDEIDEMEEPRISGDKLKQAVTTLLSPRESQIVGKIYTEGLSYKDAAVQLGVSVAMVNKGVVSALKKLRNHFKSM